MLPNGPPSSPQTISNNKHPEEFLVLGGTQYEGAKLPQILNQQL